MMNVSSTFTDTEHRIKYLCNDILLVDSIPHLCESWKIEFLVVHVDLFVWCVCFLRAVSFLFSNNDIYVCLVFLIHINNYTVLQLQIIIREKRNF